MVTDRSTGAGFSTAFGHARWRSRWESIFGGANPEIGFGELASKSNFLDSRATFWTERPSASLLGQSLSAEKAREFLGQGASEG